MTATQGEGRSAIVPAAPAGDDLRPVWLLDVDGVLNARKPGWGAAPTRRQVWSSAVRREFTVYFAPALMKRLRDLHRTGRVEIRWCTTWCGDTTVLEQAFCLPEFTTAWTEYRNGCEGVNAKQAAARAFLAEGRPLIWADDTEVPLESWPLHDELMSAGPDVLLIRPDDRFGLQPRHLDAIEQFIAPRRVTVEVGQVWADLDKRRPDRRVRVVAADFRFADVEALGTGRRSRVQIVSAAGGGSTLRGYRPLAGGAR